MLQDRRKKESRIFSCVCFGQDHVPDAAPLPRWPDCPVNSNVCMIHVRILMFDARTCTRIRCIGVRRHVCLPEDDGTPNPVPPDPKKALALQRARLFRRFPPPCPLFSRLVLLIWIPWFPCLVVLLSAWLGKALLTVVVRVAAGCLCNQGFASL